jgi:DNA replication protein DnaC
MPFDPDCPHCQGTGWRELEREGIRAVERCACGRPGAPGGRKLDLPERYRATSFDNFTCKLPGDPNDFHMLTAAFVEVRAFADEYPFGKRKGLFLQGPTGVGKTHLAVAALKRLSERGFDVVFFDYQTLLQRIRDSYNPAAGAGDRDAYRTALDAEILMLDDLGAHRATEWVTDTVTQIITHRYNEDKALIATSNLGLPEYGDVARSKDPETGQYRIADTLSDRIGDRAVSRLFEMCSPVRIRTQDYRRRDVAAMRSGMR